MSTKTKKVLVTIATLLLVILIGTSSVFALAPSEIKPQNVNGVNTIADAGGKILNILQTVGVVLAVVILIVLGIKYMMGSAEEKAEYKKTMIPYVIGAVFIFAAPTLANIVYEFVKSL